MIWNVVSDSSCDLRMASFQDSPVRFETVPLRIQVGEREFIDNDDMVIPDLLAAMAAEIARGGDRLRLAVMGGVCLLAMTADISTIWLLAGGAVLGWFLAGREAV